MKIEELMAGDLIAVRSATSLEEVAAVLAEHGIPSESVVAGTGLVLGFASEADILVNEQGMEARHGIVGRLLRRCGHKREFTHWVEDVDFRVERGTVTLSR
jgi:predicted transcriptional regulator